MIDLRYVRLRRGNTRDVLHEELRFIQSNHFGAILQGKNAALVRKVLLPSIPCRHRLAAIEKLNFDVLNQFEQMDAAGTVQTQLALLYHSLRGSY